MAIKLITTETSQTHVNCLLYGASGVGKTFAASTCPNPLILSAEDGLLSLSDFKLPVIKLDNRHTINEVHEWLKKSKEAKQYETIYIDSISEVAETLLHEEMQTNRDGRAAYGEMANLMTLTIRGYRSLPFHTVFTAKVKKVVDDSTGTITHMPSVPGQLLLNNLSYLFDEVFLMEIGQMKDRTKYRYFQTLGDRRYTAKDRSGKLAEKEKPDFTSVFNKILSQNADANTNADAKKPQEGK